MRYRLAVMLGILLLIFMFPPKVYADKGELVCFFLQRVEKVDTLAGNAYISCIFYRV